MNHYHSTSTSRRMTRRRYSRRSLRLVFGLWKSIAFTFETLPQFQLILEEKSKAIVSKIYIECDLYL